MFSGKEGFFRKNGYFEGSPAEWAAIAGLTVLVNAAIGLGFYKYSENISQNIRPYERIARACLNQDQVNFLTSTNQTSGVAYDFAEAGASIRLLYRFDNEQETAQRLRDNLGAKGATVAMSYDSILVTTPKYEARNCEVRIRV